MCQPLRRSREQGKLPFASLDNPTLLSVGVPADWLGDVRAATEDAFFELAAHLPAEAAEALLDYATGGTMPVPAPPPSPILSRIPTRSAASG